MLLINKIVIYLYLVIYTKERKFYLENRFNLLNEEINKKLIAL